jgi:hypothetical protein
MKKKTGSKSRMTKKVAGKRGVLATAKRTGSSKAMKATRAAAMLAGDGELQVGGGKK